MMRNTAPTPPDVKRANAARMRASGMAELLREILDCGALDQHGDDDLITRVQMAIADQDPACRL